MFAKVFSMLAVFRPAVVNKLSFVCLQTLQLPGEGLSSVAAFSVRAGYFKVRSTEIVNYEPPL